MTTCHSATTALKASMASYLGFLVIVGVIWHLSQAADPPMNKFKDKYKDEETNKEYHINLEYKV
jgi:hypothetical protein